MKITRRSLLKLPAAVVAAPLLGKRLMVMKASSCGPTVAPDSMGLDVQVAHVWDYYTDHDRMCELREPR